MSITKGLHYSRETLRSWTAALCALLVVVGVCGLRYHRTSAFINLQVTCKKPACGGSECSCWV